MNKRKVILTSLLGVASLGAITTGVAVGLTSCGSNKNQSNKINIETYKVGFNTNTRNVVDENVVDEIDPNFNNNVAEKLEEIFKNKQEIVQADMNRWILEFLTAFEYEKEGIWNEIEAEINDDVPNPIQVENVRMVNKTITFDANVNLEVNDTAKIVNVKDLTMDIKFAGKAELVNYIQQIKGLSNSNFIEAEIDDIYELYLGETNDKDWDDELDWDDKFDVDEYDPYEEGILKYVSNFNDKVSQNAKMIGYEFNPVEMVNKIFGTAIGRKIITKPQQNIKCWAPSTKLNSIFVPEFETGINLNLNIQKVKENFTNYLEAKQFFTTNKDKFQNVINKLQDLDIKLPTQFSVEQIRKINVINEFDWQDGKSFEVEIINKNNQKIEFEFYNNWWK